MGNGFPAHDSLDFVFWAEEARFSFFVGMREEMDECVANAEQAGSDAGWLRTFLSQPFESGGHRYSALLSDQTTRSPDA